MFYAVYSANLAPNKKSKDEIDMYESDDEYCPMEDLEYLEFKSSSFWMAILMMRFVYLIRLQLVLNKQMHSVTYMGSKKKTLAKIYHA